MVVINFVKNNLGPALRKAGLGDKKLMIWDHNRGMMYQRASGVLDDPAAAKYVWGVAFHWYMSSYYHIGHFSKFIRPGARRIISSFTEDSLMTTAFLNRDGRIAVVVLNTSDKEQPFQLWFAGEAAPTVSPAHSIMTLVLTNPKAEK